MNTLVLAKTRAGMYIHTFSHKHGCRFQHEQVKMGNCWLFCPVPNWTNILDVIYVSGPPKTTVHHGQIH